MFRKSQTALERYKDRRGFDGESPQKPSNGITQWKYVRVAVLMLLLFGVAWPLLPRSEHPVQLNYEIDLSAAPEGSLTITLMAEGKLPRSLDLEFPPGVFGDTGNGVEISAPVAHAINEDGSQGHHLIIDQIRNGWRMKTDGTQRAGFIYQVDLSRVGGLETDIRRHISTPVKGGVRVAGFEIFLEPVGVPVDDITVTVHNPNDLPLLVPWPALVRGRPLSPDSQPMPSPEPDVQLVQDAHLGAGEGYLPGAQIAATENDRQPPLDSAPAAEPVPANLFYHPHDLADLNNSLLVCGDIRTSKVQARDCVIQYATDRQWLFEDERVLDLVRKIARTEIGFFGSAPQDQITVLLAANEVRAEGGFDVYGVHTGSSVLVMVDKDINWGMLEEQAASVIAHEMFHGWLGEAVVQWDPTTLWFTEGATTWYSSRILAAAGIWEPDHAKRVISSRLERDYAQSDFLGTIPIAEANAQVMASGDLVRYSYAGGVAACMALDDYIAQRSGQKAPLDLVVRHLYQTRDAEGLTRAKLEQAILDLTHVDCHQWLESHVYGVEAVAPAGIDFSGSEDPGLASR